MWFKQEASGTAGSADGDGVVAQHGNIWPGMTAERTSWRRGNGCGTIPRRAGQYVQRHEKQSQQHRQKRPKRPKRQRQGEQLALCRTRFNSAQRVFSHLQIVKPFLWWFQDTLIFSCLVTCSLICFIYFIYFIYLICFICFIWCLSVCLFVLPVDWLGLSLFYSSSSRHLATLYTVYLHEFSLRLMYIISYLIEFVHFKIILKLS